MNIYKILFTLFALASSSATAFAQSTSIGKANNDVDAFVSQYNGGAANAGMYESLYSSYNIYVNALRHDKDNSAMAGLRKIYPYMIDGAVFFSQNNSPNKALQFALAYIDIPMMEEFSNERFSRSDYYPTICFYAATTSFNSKKYKDAIRCFIYYINTGEEKNLEKAYTYLARSYKLDDKVEDQLKVLKDAVKKYPTQTKFFYEGINASIELKDNVSLEYFVDGVLTMDPYDRKVLPIKAKLLTDKGDYAHAMPIYETLYKYSPNDHNLKRTYAMVSFNFAARLINSANIANDVKQYKQQRQEANSSLKVAAELFEELAKEEPDNLQILSALADTYKCQGRESNAKKIIGQIEARGGKYVATNVISLGNSARPDDANEGEAGTKIQNLNDVPPFSVYAKAQVEAVINKWQLKDDYETLSEYRNRVNEMTREEKIKETAKKIEEQYVADYGNCINLDNLRLEKYDAENGVFLITSPYIGNMLLPVPRDNDEARNFEAQWTSVKTEGAKFCVSKDKLALSQLTFRMANGKEYVYRIDASLTYRNENINYNFDALDMSDLAMGSDQSGGRIINTNVDIGKSDVDSDIPETGLVNENLFAVIISNENYRRETKVQFANNDGNSFKQYCIKTLGCPEKNVHYVADATLNDINAELDWMKTVATAFGGQAKLIFYYSGHGVPDEETKSSYLLPVDGYGSKVTTGYSLDKLYSLLGSLPSEQITVFLDACFSGAQRDGVVMASSARGVVIKPKRSAPQGKMVVMSAATDSETAYPYKEKFHGLFTYYLLKKLKETKGEVNYGELIDYVQSEVSRKSIVENNKSQTPTCNASSSLMDEWRGWRFIEPQPVETEAEPTTTVE